MERSYNITEYLLDKDKKKLWSTLEKRIKKYSRY